MFRPRPVRSRSQCHLTLQALDERAVPATLVDLTTRGSEGIANGAIFRQDDAHPTGTGVIRSFLRVQATGVEQGYNTDARPLQLNENSSPQFTRSLQLGQVPVINVKGVEYREFLLDINQKSSSSLLTLDELRIYIGTSGNLRGYDAATKTLAGMNPRFDLDANGDATVTMDYRLNPGSGGGDVLVLIPNAVFAGSSASQFVYLYSKFGAGVGAGANSGFEEWAVRTPSASCEPAKTTSLSGRVYVESDGVSGFTAGDLPLAGVKIQLLDANGLVVNSVLTGADGTYSFTNVIAGTYTLLEDPVEPYFDFASVAGSVNTQTRGTYNGPNSTSQISLYAGDIGVGYDFIESMTDENPT